MLGGVENKLDSIQNDTLFILIVEQYIGIFKLKNLGEAMY